MKLKRLISLVVLALALVFSCIPKTPDRPTPPAPDPPVPEDPDPITMITTPGAYGLEGGDVIFDSAVNQLSIVEYSGGRSYRLLDPQKLSVTSISGLPRVLKSGETVSFLYRVLEQGHSTVSSRYEMTVFQLKEDKAWLKQNDSTFVVIPLL
ncbi:MAG: hypothetical protein IK052_06225 [Bacteroidales bacterium]|nr:hypothetical protein [Bacteroidales bacterium]